MKKCKNRVAFAKNGLMIAMAESAHASEESALNAERTSARLRAAMIETRLRARERPAAARRRLARGLEMRR